MLLQVQKPGLMYAASAVDWNERFERRPKAGARPLLILWPFGPSRLSKIRKTPKENRCQRTCLAFLLKVQLTAIVSAHFVNGWARNP
jgi:hypothetical protein